MRDANWLLIISDGTGNGELLIVDADLISQTLATPTTPPPRYWWTVSSWVRFHGDIWRPSWRLLNMMINRKGCQMEMSRLGNRCDMVSVFGSKSCVFLAVCGQIWKKFWGTYDLRSSQKYTKFLLIWSTGSWETQLLKGKVTNPITAISKPGNDLNPI